MASYSLSCINDIAAKVHVLNGMVVISLFLYLLSLDVSDNVVYSHIS